MKILVGAFFVMLLASLLAGWPKDAILFTEIHGGDSTLKKLTVVPIYIVIDVVACLFVVVLFWFIKLKSKRA